MRKADYIVACLLEASPTGTTLRFGPGDDPYGEEFLTFKAALEDESEENMIDKGYTFMVQKNPGDIGVYGLTPQIKTLEHGTDLVAQTFGIDPETKVNFSQVPRAPGKPIPLKDILREYPMHKKSGEMASEHPVSTARKNPVKAAGVIAQPAAEKEPEMEQPNAEREKYIHSIHGPAIRNERLDFGMEVDVTYRQVGVLVSHIVPGGPAAKAGLQAGDRITMLSFETSQGSWGPYAVKKLDDFKKLRLFMESGYTVGLRYIRGGFENEAGIRPDAVQTPKAPSTEMQLTNTQNDPFIRAWSGMEKDRASLSALTISELAQAYQITPQQVVFILNKLGAQTRDYLPSDQQPNERDPASLTGNLPANTSALT